MKKEFQEKSLIRGLNWLIKLRWIAVFGTFLIISGVQFVLGIELPLFPLYAGVLVLLICNSVFFQYNQKLKAQIEEESWLKKANRFANVQISLDLGLLIYLIYFSGSMENPFIFYFIFHMVIASILLSNKAAYLQASLAVTLLIIMSLGEYFGYLPHYHLNGFIEQELYNRSYYLAGIFFAFISTIYLTVYMATFIVNQLREREEELVVLNEQLAKQDRVKSQYVATISHDLVASLSTQRNYLEALLDGLAGPFPEKARKVLVKVTQRTSNLLSFVSDLLDLSRIRTSREFTKESFSLVEAVNKIVDHLKPEIEDKNLSIDLQFPQNDAQVYANYNSIEEVLINLIKNAIRYTPSSGSIGIKITELKPECFHVTVWDTGIGIPEEDLDKIFNEFYRSKNAAQMVKDGTGLGLPIVKEIIEAHNGDIWVESQLGKGSKFTFSISD